jgi:hypothetical protein
MSYFSYHQRTSQCGKFIEVTNYVIYVIFPYISQMVYKLKRGEKSLQKVYRLVTIYSKVLRWMENSFKFFHPRMSFKLVEVDGDILKFSSCLEIMWRRLLESFQVSWKFKLGLPNEISGFEDLGRGERISEHICI